MQTYTTYTIAKLFKLTERRVQQLSQEGILPKIGRGQYELVPTVQAYVEYLKQQFSSEISTDDIVKNRNRLTLARAELYEIEKSKLEEELIPASVVKKTWMVYITMLKNKLLSIPNKVAPLMVTVENINEAKQILKERIYDSLDEIATINITNKSQGNEGDTAVKPKAVEATTKDDDKRVE